MSHDQSSCSLDSPLAPPSWFAWSCLWTKLTRFCCAACSRNCWAASSSRVSENQLKCQFRYITHHKFISDSSMNMITDLTETNRKWMSAGVGQPAPTFFYHYQVKLSSREPSEDPSLLFVFLKNSKFYSNFVLSGGRTSKVKQQHPCERANLLLLPEIPGKFPSLRVTLSAIG